MEKTPICCIRQPKLETYQSIYRSVIYKGKTWNNGDTIDIAFLNGTKEEIAIVKEVYGELSFLNLTFNFVSDSKVSDIRWTFTKGLGSWSFLGTDAMFVDKSSSTVNIGWTVDKSTVRHELGHSLGLAHEHQSPNATINWDRDAVIKDLSGPPNNWSVEQIDYNVFNTLNRELVYATSFDTTSIMLYGFPAHWTKDRKGTPFNTNWSTTDIATLKKFYPKTDPVNPVEPTVDCKVITKELLNKVFTSKDKLNRLTEAQLIEIANFYNIPASIDDLKKVTVGKIYSILQS